MFYEEVYGKDDEGKLARISPVWTAGDDVASIA